MARRISIVTPSFRSAQWLKLCIASVADQNAGQEHIVQDSCSDDGTQDWLPQDPRVSAFIEKDSGMYDAVNRGLRRATGEIVAYLNCDEQYLPGALHAVLQYFDDHPGVEIVFADALVVDPDGGFICYRKFQKPREAHTRVASLPTFSSSMFFRRSLLERGFYFDTAWRDLGDAEWVLRALTAKVHIGMMRRFASVFTDTGANMNLSPNAQKEKERMRQSAPGWARALTPALVASHRLRRMMGGIYRQSPFDYNIYTRQSPDKRVNFHVAKPTFIWKSRLSWTT